MALRHWLQLALTEGLGPILTRRLIASTETVRRPATLEFADAAEVVAATGSAAAACEMAERDLRGIEGIGSKKAAAIFRSLRDAAPAAEAELARAAAAGVTMLCPDDADYPVMLRSIPDPPPVLYVRGALEPRDLHSLAIVGSRRCSYYGREQAERFGALLAGAGLTVISGGARGIDSAAHRGALSHPQGRTIAVLGSGVDVAYPPENKPLFDQIAARGAVLSEHPLGTPPLAENFPRRNRIVSGLARGVLVIEADERSGALITARQAGEDHGRPVFALPGKVDNPLSVGPHQLIRDGATLAASLDHILDGLGPLPQDALEPIPFALAVESAEQPAPAAPPLDLSLLSDAQQLIFANLGSDPANVDRLIESTALPSHVVLKELTMMTLKGLVKRVGGQSFVRAR